MIKSLSGEELDFANCAIESDSEVVLSIKIDCTTNYKLTAEIVSGIDIYAKFQGDVSFTDIVSGELDLTDFDGEEKTVEIKIAAGTFPIPTFEVIKINVQL